MDIEVTEASIVGGRDRQEDAHALATTDRATYGIVADGLGGHPYGDEASQLLVGEFADLVHCMPFDDAFALALGTVRRKRRGLTTATAVRIDREGYARALVLGDSPLRVDGRRYSQDAPGGPLYCSADDDVLVRALHVSIGKDWSQIVLATDGADLDPAMGEDVLDFVHRASPLCGRDNATAIFFQKSTR